ncbi:hypothetical protein Q31a_56940 [Aureliella helgolandensis]|uniref:Uncharacterized protein n=1 Tax=Aureliella helgolandensis TaxID=2527968 RepID=A0A518GFD4_9BACT|nr:hypothetical protein Q31a_56940 [Aureliella helgolandensis]
MLNKEKHVGANGRHQIGMLNGDDYKSRETFPYFDRSPNACNAGGMDKRGNMTKGRNDDDCTKDARTATDRQRRVFRPHNTPQWPKELLCRSLRSAIARGPKIAIFLHRKFKFCSVLMLPNVYAVTFCDQQLHASGAPTTRGKLQA